MNFLLQLLVGWMVEESTAFVHNPSAQIRAITTAHHHKSITTAVPFIKSRLFAIDSEDDTVDSLDDTNDNSNNDKDMNAEEPSSSSPSFETDCSTVRIDDGGSDLTNRFKYKVHALMGDYDPTDGVADDEYQDGNIMRALFTFPMQQTFDVVGKISADDDKDANEYAESVKKIVFETTGDENIEYDISPRGKKFTKVSCTAMVESMTMINTIYDELGQMESTIMKF